VHSTEQINAALTRVSEGAGDLLGAAAALIARGASL